MATETMGGRNALFVYSAFFFLNPNAASVCM